MPDRTNVVPSSPTVTEEQFHTSVVVGMARAQQRLGGQKAIAYTMDLSAKQIGNIMAGATPGAKALFDLHKVEGTALSDVADLYGFRMVPKDAICSGDGKPLSVLTCALLSKAIDAELDGIEDHNELLGMEAELRAMRAAIDRRLTAISELRTPRAVSA